MLIGAKGALIRARSEPGKAMAGIDESKQFVPLKFAVLLIKVIFPALEVRPIALHRVPDDLERILAA